MKIFIEQEKIFSKLCFFIPPMVSYFRTFLILSPFSFQLFILFLIFMFFLAEYIEAPSLGLSL